VDVKRIAPGERPRKGIPDGRHNKNS
jgi:hypothetical protein